MEHPNNKLLDLSDEVLLRIFSNFNEIDLLNVAAVCKRFEVIAKDVFAERYNGKTDEKYYEIKLYPDNSKYDQRLHRKIIETFGNEIAAIKLNAEESSNRHKLITLIGQHCRSTKYVIIKCDSESFQLTHMIRSMQSLTRLTLKYLSSLNFYWADIHYPRLTYFSMEGVSCVDVEVLKRFVYINPQLKHLRIFDCRKFPLKVIQALRTKMKTLKSLEYESDENDFENNCRDVELEQLESLKIAVSATSMKKVLEAIARGSKNIKHLKVWFCEDEDEEDIAHNQLNEIIQLFGGLTSLHLEHFDLTINGVGDVAQHLPQLVSLKVDGVRLNEISSIDVLYLFTTCKHLKELLLESEYYVIRAEQFDSHFHRKFVGITRNRGDGVKFEVIQPITDANRTTSETITITSEQIIRNGKLLRWIASRCEASNSQIVHFLDLGDKCLGKIYSYLDEQSERALYETCTRTKAAMQDRIKAQLFTVHTFDSAEDTLNRFGEHMTKLSIDMNKNNRIEMSEIWKLVSRKYSIGIIELCLNNVRVNAMENSSKPEFPNLKTLKIMSLVASRSHIFPPMECPKLAHLEFNSGKITLPTKASNYGISLNQLKSIRLTNFSKNIETILYALNEKVCDQIQSFEVEHESRTADIEQRIVYMITRFRNLTTLNFLLPKIVITNTKYLFESCTKLVKLLLSFDCHFDTDDLRRMLRHIKLNCKHLEEIQILDDRDQVNNDLVTEISNTFPRVKFSIIHHDTDNSIYRVETYRKITKLDRANPF
ncbi:uncharacterized protein LOC129566013 [Sitodiplosis mosellana]|uniref:uncharacterized protein LOC129566013 n=1 Tax=Sitodiplosis mosellana TaxID=263140 RepID=UPI0024448E51|nr:uncharacterized protein LOC129566013 [Sitodiplosis mosellana]XP_055297474.1 uncharacterized protein LOC129566013 [Sitodiplosis mosellana]